ncbi:hypothetical protein PSAB6_660023 [Paraburkholderia sabiae]|nr:hypothetical protein PSAB6_660023 [Paraburkholderia sabiae]
MANRCLIGVFAKYLRAWTWSEIVNRRAALDDKADARVSKLRPDPMTSLGRTPTDNAVRRFTTILSFDTLR